jgi:hypothetical protein
LYQKALDISRKIRGEEHPDTANSYNNLAYNLQAQGRSAEAATMLRRAIPAHEASRQSAATGLERASLNRFDPRLILASLLAPTDPGKAWTQTELSLARGLLDEQLARSAVSLTPAEQAEQARLRQQLAVLQPRILFLVTQAKRTDDETKELDDLLVQRRKAEEKLAAIAVALSQRQVATPESIQAALVNDAAIVYWVDVTDKFGKVQERWGCVVRSTGEPHWERLPGSGKSGKWTDADTSLPSQLRATLAGTPGDLPKLIARLHAQRIAPLEKHLAGVKTLYVVPVQQMAGIPVEAITDRYTVAYVPSGTFLARLKDRAAPKGDRLLALGDPVFDIGGPKTAPPSDLPPGGLLVMAALPGGNAAKNARLLAGDVLLKYADVELTRVEQLDKLAAEHASDKAIPLTYWRQGQAKPITRDVKPGKLDVILANEPAREAITKRRDAEALLAKLRGGEWKDLPGTRIELAQLLQVFRDRTTVLADSDASEQRLEDLRTSGKLKDYRILHFATHGEANNERAFESVLILAQDRLPKDPPRAGEKFIDGKLSAREVLETWQLDADLVTLSACETALGRAGGGDGLLGFVQAFLTAGSRGVLLSLWNVDDAATALLMDRFYRNWLGKREGLKAPMPKMEALTEAKQWLRNLPKDEALRLTVKLTNGVARGKGQKPIEAKDVSLPKVSGGPQAKPFAHPHYWSAFVLIGDPR